MKKLNENQQKGYDLTVGVVRYLEHRLIWFLIAFMIVLTILKHCGVGSDDSDISPTKRSGMRVLFDAKTGIEYLSDGHGGLVERGVSDE